MTGIPRLEPCGEDAHQRGEDGVDRADKAGRICLHDEVRPDGCDQVEDSPCRGQDAIRPHEDRVAQRRVSVIAVLGVMRGQGYLCEARDRPDESEQEVRCRNHEDGGGSRQQCDGAGANSQS